MADYALLDELGVGKEFNFRYEIGRYHGCGLSDQELEEEGSDIVLAAYLEWDWNAENAGPRFYSYCRTNLLALLRLAEKRRQVMSLTDYESDLPDEVVTEIVEVKETEYLRNLTDEYFMENIYTIFREVFSEKGDEKYLIVARKYFIEQKSVREVGTELGWKHAETVHRCIKSIRYRFKDYVRRHSARLYSYFDESLADAIIDLASA